MDAFNKTLLGIIICSVIFFAVDIALAAGAMVT